MSMIYQVVAQFALSMPAPPESCYLGELVMSKHNMHEQALELRQQFEDGGAPVLIHEIMDAQARYYGRRVTVTYSTRATLG